MAMIVWDPYMALLNFFFGWSRNSGTHDGHSEKVLTNPAPANWRKSRREETTTTLVGELVQGFAKEALM